MGHGLIMCWDGGSTEVSVAYMPDGIQDRD